MRTRLRQALRLYVIPDRAIGAPRSLEEQTRLAVEGGATAIQLRDKEADGGELLRAARALAALCRERRVLFIVNDRLDVALLCGADGVHLGQSDIPVREARRLAPRPFVIGASAHTPEEAARARADGADYLGVGAVFGTGSKDNATVIGLEGLRAAVAATDLPCAAIGGIGLENLRGVMRCGVDGISVISASVRGDVRPRTALLREALAATAQETERTPRGCPERPE
ncbi:MAG: thiamine phosphate synthase [Synergistaceae bacterium]|jgi:thiamine-phosphate pyrophosphorylase|nr:thiamine phosphate synthase [Synergistaceae bacterium]